MHALALINQPSMDAPPHRAGEPAFDLVDVSAPQLSVLDLGATRGDGVFEAISVASGHAQALEPHLSRFAKSAATLDLPAPDVEVWRAAILAVAQAIEGMPAGSIKVVYTRGIEGDGRPTGWVYGSLAPDFDRVRAQGVRVVTLDRGYRHDVASTSPWLLVGAKTLSYAVNRAVLREAARRDADDVIFISSDGFVLEGPTSSVLIRRGDTLVTPGSGLAILEGTTQGSIFAFAEANGLATGFELATVDQLRQADALWLVSSVRHAVPVTALDGVAMPVDTALTAAMNEYLASRVD